MKKPTKKQLVDSVTHYQNAIQNLVDTYANQPGAEDFVDALKHVQNNAPSLEPVGKAEAEETETIPVTEAAAE